MGASAPITSNLLEIIMSLSNLIKNAGLWGPGVTPTSQFSVTTTTGMTNLATSFKITTDIVSVTTSGATGNAMALPAGAAVGDTVVVGNLTANALSILPATAAGKINAGAAGAAFAQTASKNASYLCIGNDNWLAVLSA